MRGAIWPIWFALLWTAQEWLKCTIPFGGFPWGVVAAGQTSGPFLPLVHATFEQKPLAEALREMAEQTEYNIVLDNRAGEKAKAEVSARFVNTPLDTAVNFVADMVDLRTILLDNVIYVTTRENAALMESRLKKDPNDAAESAGPRIGSGVASPMTPAGAPAGM